MGYGLGWKILYVDLLIFCIKRPWDVLVYPELEDKIKVV